MKIINIILAILLTILFVYSLDKIFTSGSSSSDYFSALVSIIVGWITYMVALSADRSSSIAVDLQKRAQELEEKSEAPFVVPKGINIRDPFAQTYVPSSTDNLIRRMWIVLSNEGDGPAFDIEFQSLEYLNDRHTYSFLRAGDAFPEEEPNYGRYNQKLFVCTDLPEARQTLTFSFTYKDLHGSTWGTKFDLFFDSTSTGHPVNGVIFIRNIKRFVPER